MKVNCPNCGSQSLLIWKVIVADCFGWGIKCPKCEKHVSHMKWIRTLIAGVVLLGFPSVYAFSVVPDLKLHVWRLILGIFCFGLIIYFLGGRFPLIVREFSRNNGSNKKNSHALLGVLAGYIGLIVFKYLLFGGSMTEMFEFSMGLLVPSIVVFIGIVLNRKKGLP